MINILTAHPRLLSFLTPISILSLSCIINLMQIYMKPLSNELSVKATLFTSISLALTFLFIAPPQYDPFTQLIFYLLLATTLALCILVSGTYLESSFFKGEVAFFVCVSLIGLMTSISSQNICTIFLGIEISFIGTCNLLGFMQPNRFNQEGVIKYFILGSIASSIMLFGFGMIYVSTGSADLGEAVDVLRSMNQSNLWVQIGLTAFFIGLSFKIGLVPCHLWAPDTYESAPTVVTAFMMISFKVVVTSILLQSFGHGFNENLFPFSIKIAGLSILIGSLLTLVQTSVKRLLAYSYISQSGFLLLCLASPSKLSSLAMPIAFYLISFSFAVILAFGIIMQLEDRINSNINLDDLQGLAKSRPWYALGLSVALLSAAGAPLTAGFISKYLLLPAQITEHAGVMHLLIASCHIVIFVRFLQLIVHMHRVPNQHVSNEGQLKSPALSKLILSTVCIATILLGTIFPNKAIQIIGPMVKSSLKSP